jgi:hypothetical protein
MEVISWHTNTTHHLTEIFSLANSSSSSSEIVAVILKYAYDPIWVQQRRTTSLYVFKDQKVQFWAAPEGVMLADVRLQQQGNTLKSSLEEMAIDEYKDRFFSQNPQLWTVHLCDAVNIVYQAHDKFRLQMDERKCCQLLEDSWISSIPRTWWLESPTNTVIRISSSKPKYQRVIDPHTKQTREIWLDQKDFSGPCLVQRREDHDVLVLHTLVIPPLNQYRFFYANLATGKMRLLDNIPALAAPGHERLAWTREYLFQAHLSMSDKAPWRDKAPWGDKAPWSDKVPWGDKTHVSDKEKDLGGQKRRKKLWIASRLLLDTCAIYDSHSYDLPLSIPVSSLWVYFGVTKGAGGGEAHQFFLVFRSETSSSSLSTDYVWCLNTKCQQLEAKKSL